LGEGAIVLAWFAPADSKAPLIPWPAAPGS